MIIAIGKLLYLLYFEKKLEEENKGAIQFKTLATNFSYSYSL